VINDLKKIKLRNWSQIIKDGEDWNDLVQKTTTHVGLQCQKNKKLGSVCAHKVSGSNSTAETNIKNKEVIT
jgi:hypothetical protein